MPIERIRGRRLQAIRKRWFAINPLCVTCQKAGRVRLATQLDHIVALTNGGPDDDTNRQGLCATCHDLKTNEDLGHGPSGACGADGWPTDPTHTWNR